MNNSRPMWSKEEMKRSQVTVPWKEGLHLHPATSLAKKIGTLHSTVWFKIGRRRADARNVLSVLILAASMGTMLDVEAKGDDEQFAIDAVEQIFLAEAATPGPHSTPVLLDGGRLDRSV